MARAERRRVRAGDNVYLERVLAAKNLLEPSRDLIRRIDALLENINGPISYFQYRDVWAPGYAWAIPNDAALEAIAKHGPILEVGAGTGYWAALLRARGVDIVATDQHGPGRQNHWHRRAFAWTDLEVLDGVTAVRKYRDRALFLCWPPYMELESSYHVLRAFKGDVVLYIGEGAGGCTASWKFHDLLDAQWDLEDEVDLPNWHGIHDRLFVYRRRPATTRTRMPRRHCYTCGRFIAYDYGECDRCIRLPSDQPMVSSGRLMTRSARGEKISAADYRKVSKGLATYTAAMLDPGEGGILDVIAGRPTALDE